MPTITPELLEKLIKEQEKKSLFSMFAEGPRASIGFNTAEFIKGMSAVSKAAKGASLSFSRMTETLEQFRQPEPRFREWSQRMVSIEVKEKPKRRINLEQTEL